MKSKKLIIGIIVIAVVAAAAFAALTLPRMFAKPVEAVSHRLPSPLCAPRWRKASWCRPSAPR